MFEAREDDHLCFSGEVMGVFSCLNITVSAWFCGCDKCCNFYTESLEAAIRGHSSSSLGFNSQQQEEADPPMMSSDTDSKQITLQKSNVLLLGPTGSGNQLWTRDCSSTESLSFLLSLMYVCLCSVNKSFEFSLI